MILITCSIVIVFNKMININVYIKYIIDFGIACLVWSMYSSFCNVDISTLGNAVLTGLTCILEKIISMQIFKDFVVRLIQSEQFEYFQTFLNETNVLLSLLFIILSIATIICALKKYWLNKYHPKGGDIMNYSFQI